jgi:hypothetical protein
LLFRDPQLVARHPSRGWRQPPADISERR